MPCRPVHQPDLFIEIGAMWAQAGTRYRPPAAQTPSPITAGHNHLPNSTVLKLMLDPLAAGPRPIKVHFDVGDALAMPRVGHDADGYPSSGSCAWRRARERGRLRCTMADTANPGGPGGPRACEFPDDPGVVGGSSVCRAFGSHGRLDGSQLTGAAQLRAIPQEEGPTPAVIRSDPERHLPYVLFGHYRVNRSRPTRV